MKPKPRLLSRVLALFMAFALLLTALPPSVFAMEPSDIEDAIPLTLDEPVTFTNEDGKLVLSFTPEESRDYILYLQDADNCEPYVEWFDADLNRMRGWNLSQEPASLYLQAGTAIYYEITNIQDSAYFSATVCLTMPSYITFDANGGYFGDNADDSFRYFTTDENKYLTDEIPENVNHADSHKRFVGWAESPDAEAPLDNYYEAIRYRQYTEDAVFYAVYEESYVVTYDANGGYFYEDEWNEETQEWVRNEVPTYTRIYPYGMRFDVSVRPENDDSSKWFMGWKDAGGTTYDWNSEVTQDLTVYAQWADATTITFHANGGYFIEWGWDEETGQEIENHVDTLSESYLKEDPLYSWNTPTAHNDDESKAFAGWAASADAVTPDVTYEETLAGDLTDLWAVWSESIPVTYHINHDEITFIGDDNERFTEFTSYYPAGESFYIGHPPYNYSKPDGSLWQLAGLSTNPNAAQGDYREITLTEPLDLYCVWYEGVEIRFDANGGYFQNDPNYTSANPVFRLGETAYEIPSHFRDELTPPEPGLALAGWSWTADGSDPVTGDLAITRDLNGRTLYAIWSGGIPVTFHINNEGAWFFNEQGKEVDTITRIYASGATLRSYEQPFPYGVEEDSFLRLDGLSLDPNASRNDYWEITVTEPIDVYCIWYLGVEINVDANGGHFWNDPQDTAFVSVFRIGDTINLLNYWGGNWISHPDPDKALVGFSWSRDGSNPFTEFTPSEDDQYKTLYAVWAKGIKVTFHVNSDIVRFIDENGNRVETVTKAFAPGTVLWSYNDFFNYDTSGDPFLRYDGFFPEPAPSQTYGREYTITEPTDFYCSWFQGINFFFDANGGYFSGPDGTLVPVMLRIGQSCNLLTYWNRDLIAPDPSKTLVGWSWTADGSERITESTEFIPTEAMDGKTIYAVWGDGITVTYHSLNENVWFLDSGGNKTDTIQVSYTQGTVLDFYNIDVRYYYDDSVSRWFFDRYYLDAGGTTRVDDNITITEPIDLYCTWYEGVLIDMNANGGLFWGEQEIVNYVYRLGTTIDLEQSTYNITPPSPDLALAGWSRTADGSQPVSQLSITKDLDGIMLYAIWDEGIRVTLHSNLEGAYFIDSNGNQVSDLELTVKDGTILEDILWQYIAVSPNATMQDSYSRSLTPNGEALSPDTVLTDGMDLYVIWSKVIPLIFDAGDGTIYGQQTYQTSIRVGNNYYFSPDWYTAKPGQEGMAFLGWSLTTSKEDIVRGRFYPKETDESITLHAIYAPGHPLTIISNNPEYGKFGVFENGESYDYDNPAAEASFLYAQGKELNFLAVDIIRSEGCIFLGWSKTIDGEILDWSYVPDGDDTLYGIFAEGYEVYFIANGGTFDETMETTVSYWLEEVPKGSAIGEVSVWHPSKQLVGWNTKADGSGEMIDPATYIPTGYMELYAIWGDGGSVPVTGVSFANASVTIKVEETKSYPATVAPANATNKKVTYKSSDESIVTVDANGKITGQRTGSATITATTADGGKKATMKVQVLFKDVADSSKYWYKPVYWAADKGITNGYQSASYIGTAKFGTFGADENCTREQMITFLYREAGSPAVSAADIAKYNTFSDVKSSASPYYLKPVVWAAKNGITKGYSSGPNKGKFGVGLTVTREDTVTFIYRMAKIYQKGFKDVTSADLKNTDYKFKDVASGKYYEKPIVWAAKNGITKGYSSGEHKGKFGVGFDVLRKDIVTFLYRYDNL